MVLRLDASQSDGEDGLTVAGGESAGAQRCEFWEEAGLYTQRSRSGRRGGAGRGSLVPGLLAGVVVSAVVVGLAVRRRAAHKAHDYISVGQHPVCGGEGRADE